MKRLTEAKLREALVKDFNTLYVREYTTDWKVERFLRTSEIKIMDLTNTLKLLEQASK